jgi:hypothetical protein
MMKRLSTLLVAAMLTTTFGLIGCGENAATVDRNDLNNRCDFALTTILNRDDVLSCEVAFEVCEDWELVNIVKLFECDLELEGVTNCPQDGQPEINETCYAEFETLTPPENFSYPGTSWCGPSSDMNSTALSGCLESTCRRHDHCNMDGTGYSGSTLACACDKDIRDARGNADSPFGLYTVIGTVFGSKNMAWPCVNYEEECDWWGDCETKWTKRRWNKYSGGSHSVGYHTEWGIGANHGSAGNLGYKQSGGTASSSGSTYGATCQGN